MLRGTGVNLRSTTSDSAHAHAPEKGKQLQVDALLARAYFEYQRQDFTKARALAQYLVTVFHHSEGEKLLAITAHKLGDEDTAAAHYPAAMEAFPSDLYVIVGYAELLLDKHSFDEAARLLAQAMELDPAAQHPAGARARILVLQAKAATR